MQSSDSSILWAKPSILFLHSIDQTPADYSSILLSKPQQIYQNDLRDSCILSADPPTDFSKWLVWKTQNLFWHYLVIIQPWMPLSQILLEVSNTMINSIFVVVFPCSWRYDGYPLYLNYLFYGYVDAFFIFVCIYINAFFSLI